MSQNSISFYPLLEKERDKDIAFEQYKLFADSIGNLSNVRESSNSFWISANTLGLSWIGHLINSDTLGGSMKPVVLTILLAVGMALCLTWFFSLQTIKKNIKLKNNILIEMESYFETKIFSKYLHDSGQQQDKNSLTVKEMLAPLSFLVAYGVFMFIVHRL